MNIKRMLVVAMLALTAGSVGCSSNKGAEKPTASLTARDASTSI